MSISSTNKSDYDIVIPPIAVLMISMNRTCKIKTFPYFKQMYYLFTWSIIVKKSITLLWKQNINENSIRKILFIKQILYEK